MFYDPRSQPHGLPHNPWMALIVPRPIGWVSTVSPEGVANLAPYSSFNTVASNPPFLMFTSEGEKDSLNNARATGHFCVNLATFELRQPMNITGAAFPPEVDEFQAAGLTAVECRNIPGVRVAQAPVSIECTVSQIITLTPATGVDCANQVVFGEVVGIHIDESVLCDGRVDIELLKPLSRMGYKEYSVPARSFEMDRLGADEIAALTAMHSPK